MNKRLDPAEMKAVKGGAAQPFWTKLLKPARPLPPGVSSYAGEVDNPFTCIYTTKRDDVDQLA